MTTAVSAERTCGSLFFKAGRNRAIDKRIHSYLTMSSFLEMDDLKWTDRKKILVHILVWKMEHKNDAMTEKALMDELSAAYGPDHLGELLTDMNGTLISYGQKAESPVEVTELGRAILLGTVRDIFNGETE